MTGWVAVATAEAVDWVVVAMEGAKVVARAVETGVVETEGVREAVEMAEGRWWCRQRRGW